MKGLSSISYSQYQSMCTSMGQNCSDCSGEFKIESEQIMSCTWDPMTCLCVEAKDASSGDRVKIPDTVQQKMDIWPPGFCDDSTTCPWGQLCQNKRCTLCSDDNQCIADNRYGPMTICVDGECTKGDCHDTSDCANTNPGKICGGTTSYTCSDCSLDAQCKNDSFYSSEKPICIKGRCATDKCNNTSNTARPCAASGTTDICCNNICIPETFFDGTSCCGTGQSICENGLTCIGNICSTGLRGKIISISSNLPPPLESNTSATLTIHFQILSSDGQSHTISADFSSDESNNNDDGFWGDVKGPTCGNLNGTTDIDQTIKVTDTGNYTLAGKLNFCINYPETHSEYRGGFSAIRLYDTINEKSISPWQKLGLITPASK